MNIFVTKTLQIKSHPGFHLVQDHIGTNYSIPWDDFGYTVKFNLYYVADGEINKIGAMRLLIDKQDDTYKYLSEEGENVDKNITEITKALSSINAVSIGTDINYYKKINFVLKDKQKQIHQTLSLLKDASFFFDSEDDYKNYEGYDSTIMREGQTTTSLIKKGFQIAQGNYELKRKVEINIDDQKGCIEPLSLKFDTKKAIGKTNINLLIGKNGVGKTHILNSLSDLITGIVPSKNKWPFFHKLVVTAYSPFEEFYTKNQLLDISESRFKKKKKRSNEYLHRRSMTINKYAYIGFKNDSGNFDLTWPKEFSVQSMIKIMELDREDSWWLDYTRLETLEKTLSLSIGFDSIAVKLKDSDEYFNFNSRTYRKFKNNKENFDVKKGLFFLKDGEPVNLSSGQEIFSYMIPSIVAEIEEESLLIVDEPELYLHPTLEIGLVNMLKIILEETNSYAIIATHSALIAREVDKDGINILRREEGEITSVSKPTIQTYGESLELIIGEAFDDYHEDKAFQQDIDIALKTLSYEEIIGDYSEELGDEALAYTNSVGLDDELIIEGR